MGPWGGGRPGGALDPGVEAHVANQPAARARHATIKHQPGSWKTTAMGEEQNGPRETLRIVKTCFETKKSTKFSETQNVAMVEKS